MNGFWGSNAREKLVIIFLFIICIMSLYMLGEKALNLVGIVAAGYLTFLKGNKIQPNEKENVNVKENETI